MEDSLQLRWKHFSAKVNGSFEFNRNTNYFDNHEAYHIAYSYNGHVIRITVYSQQIPERGKAPFLTHYTRVDIPFKNIKSIYFKLSRTDILSKILSRLINPDMKTSNVQFNSQFKLSGLPKEDVKNIFNNEQVQKYLIHFNDLYLTIVKNKNFTDFTLESGEDVLEIQINYILTNENDIDALHSLATGLLDRLIR